MPVDFLTAEHKACYGQFFGEPNEVQLAQYFHLDEADLVGEKLEAITSELKDGMPKAAVCRNFGVKRTTLIETLARIGWRNAIYIDDGHPLSDHH